MNHQKVCIPICLFGILIVEIVQHGIFRANSTQRELNHSSSLVKQFESAKYFWEQFEIGKKIGDERALAGLQRHVVDYGVTTTGSPVTVMETAEEAIRLIQDRKEPQ